MTTQASPECDNLQPWLAAYALGEADDDPHARAHLAICPRCQRDLSEYRRVAGLLPYSASEAAPPAELRDRIIAAVAGAAGSPSAANVPARLAPVSHPPRRRLSFSRAGWAAAAFAALSIALLVWNIALQREVGGQAAQIAASRQGWQSMIVLLNDEALQWYAVGGTQARGHLWATPQSQEACLVAEQLPTLAPGQVYQVWLDHGAAPSSGGTFEEHDGGAWIVVQSDGPISAYTSVFVTIEPAGGSRAPTGQRVLDGSLEHANAASATDRQQLARLLSE